MSIPNVDVVVRGPIQPSSTYKTKVLKGNHSFASQVTEANMKYVIKYDFDLNGESVTIPENCVLEFDGGSLRNGTLTGNNTCIEAGMAKILGADIILSGTYNTKNNIVLSNWFIGNNIEIKNLCVLVPDGGTIILNNDVYNNNDRIELNKSIKIEGNYNTIHIAKNNNGSNWLFDILGTDRFEMYNVIVDGGYSDVSEEINNFKTLIHIEAVDNVVIKNCTFKNLKYRHNHLSPYYPLEPFNQKYAYWGLIGIYKFTNCHFENNTIKNVSSSEGLMFYVDDDLITSYPDVYLEFTGNIMDGGRVSLDEETGRYYPIDNYISTWVNIFGCKGIVRDNYVCSAITAFNIFVHDMLISNNVVENCNGNRTKKYVCVFDLDEGAFKNFVPKNVIIDSNRVINCPSFVWFSNGKNINIRNNYIESIAPNTISKFVALLDNINASDLETLDVGIDGLVIENNNIPSCAYLYSDESLNKKKNVLIANNTIETTSVPISILAEHKNTQIVGNKITCNYTYSGGFTGSFGTAPVFVLLTSPSSLTYNEPRDFDCKINNNTFVTSESNARLFCVDSYAPENNVFHNITGFIFNNNVSNAASLLTIISQDWNKDDILEPFVSIFGNTISQMAILSNIDYVSDDKRAYALEQYSVIFGKRLQEGTNIMQGISSNINVPRIEVMFQKRLWLNVGNKRQDTKYYIGYSFTVGSKYCIVLKTGRTSSDGTVTTVGNNYVDGGCIYREVGDAVDLTNNQYAKVTNFVPSKCTSEHRNLVVLGNHIIGIPLYDTNIRKHVYWNGTAWVDATGATV